MNYATQEIVKALKTVRQSTGMSQRALAEKAGVLQTQISKIENGVTDFRLSTLVALARALELEVALVPRKVVSAVQSVIRASEPARISGRNLAGLRREFDQFRQALANLPDSTRLTIEYAQLQRQFRSWLCRRLSASLKMPCPRLAGKFARPPTPWAPPVLKP